MNHYRITHLPPTLVAACHAQGPEPEVQAWQAMRRYARRHQLGRDHGNRFFGFNAPEPHPGSPEHGYEQWVTVSADAPPADAQVELKQFPGGDFATAHCHLADIQDVWRDLVRWTLESGHSIAEGPLLEECLTPPIERPIRDDLEFDLYLPVKA